MSALKPLVINSGHQQVLPAGDTLLTNASTTGGASLNLPQGAAPTSPNNGDMWTTTAGLFVEIAGSTVGPLGTGGGGGSPGGSPGQIQYNNAGAFGGFTMSGDATLVTSTGILTIANAAVTLAKIQDATANSKLLGSGASGSGASYSEITLGTGLAMTGTTLSVTVTAPTAANPTATAGPSAVNGSAATFMRSDAAPAVQLGSASQPGILQVDGTTITESGGVISAAAALANTNALELAHGLFVTAAHTNVASETVDTFISYDGVSWTQFGSTPIFSTFARDPALFHYDGQWWIATTNDPGGQNWLLFTSSDLLTWSGPSTISTSSISGPAWAPQWFVDHDGLPHILVAIGNTFKSIYEMHPTARDMSTWSAPALLLGDGTTERFIDPSLVRIGNTYNLFYKDDNAGTICLATSTSLLSGYSIVKTGNWAGWATGLSGTIEGPSITQMDDGRWRIYFTNNNVAVAFNIMYSETVDSTLQSGWSAATAMSSLSGYNHAVPLRIPGALDALERVWEQLGQPNGIATLDSSGKLPAGELPSIAASGIANDSGVSGTTVKDALNTLNTTAHAWSPMVNGDLPGPTFMVDPLGQTIACPI